YENHGFGLWAMVDKDTGQMVGQMGLTLQNTDKGQELEIGYLLKRKHWKKGYAIEGAMGVRDYAFDVLGAERVTSIIRENNLASRKVAERNGMQVERSFIKHYKGVDMPHIVYAMIPADREAMKKEW
ncbi:GNAT family N-acetyltransferase, partial [Eubacteriales bacterium OttesenSCG-928-M02]|nr:GNAT family N-acetyltransferase [Eubacteriales bacterium OttesenSCG-928-M02]